MYVRKKHNRSGSTSVVVVSKTSGKYKEIKSFGSSTSEEEIDSLCAKAATWIRSFGGQQELDFDDRKGKEVEETERFLGNIDSVLINGTLLLLNQVYDSIGFNRIPDEILRHLVIARVSQPRSKLATVDYLKSYYDEDVDLNHIYRYMDKLYNTQMELAQQISVEHTRKLFGGKIGLMFYDVTTLYFETAQTDILREPGFSKDGKTAESQVVLGLLVSEGGYPLSYSLFNGSQYEGFTMIPMIDDLKQRFNLGKDFVVVADSGLMNKNNVTLLQEAGYKYILGARIKNESASVKQWILSQEKVDKACYNYERENGERLIVSYSEKRAKKDAYNRDRGIARLRKAYKSGHITKNQVNKRGYNKFLEISKDIEVVISEEKIAEDCKWDGLKGYITNTDLDAERVIAEYHGLWVVERAFRVSKRTLDMRPMFHFTERRIEAHVCICFIAYKVYKELERLIAVMKQLPLFVTMVAIMLSMALLISKPLNAMQLGDAYAQNLGVNLRIMRHAILLLVGGITAVTTAYCGPVSFIGLAVPHISRLLMGKASNALLLPSTLIVGAATGLLCSWFTTIPSTTILPLNAVTPFIGIPVIIWVVAKR